MRDPDGNLVFRNKPGTTISMRPLYPLTKVLEREWPVSVPESAVPAFFTQAMYNSVAVGLAAAIATTGVALAFTLSQFLSFYYIPSRSMETTLAVGDVLLVEKV